MSETRCPNGHLFTESDYCDVCGARLEPTAPLTAQLQATSPPASAGSPGLTETNADTRFEAERAVRDRTADSAGRAVTGNRA